MVMVRQPFCMVNQVLYAMAQGVQRAYRRAIRLQRHEEYQQGGND